MTHTHTSPGFGYDRAQLMTCIFNKKHYEIHYGQMENFVSITTNNMNLKYKKTPNVWQM